MVWLSLKWVLAKHRWLVIPSISSEDRILILMNYVSNTEKAQIQTEFTATYPILIDKRRVRSHNIIAIQRLDLTSRSTLCQT